MSTLDEGRKTCSYQGVGNLPLRRPQLFLKGLQMTLQYPAEPYRVNTSVLRCTRCGHNLNFERGDRFGLCNVCKDSLRYIKRDKKKKERAKNNPQSGPNVGLLVVLKRRLSTALNREFRRHRQIERSDLTMAYLVSLYEKQKGCCAISGRSLSLGSVRTGEYEKDTLSIDRIDSSRGYIQGNVHLVTLQVNYAKNQGSLEDLKNLCNDIINHLTVQ